MNPSVCNITAIHRYLDDELSPDEEALLETHLCECDECRSRIGQSAGSGADWASVAAALTLDEMDRPDEEATQPAWPLALLGPTDDPRMLGRIGPFEVSGCVGVGGMGVVFKARDPALDRFVAVKVLAPQLAASESARMRFAREAKAAAAVVHDNVIAIHQVSEYQGLPYLVMPYLPGPSLEQRLQRHGAMNAVEAVRVAHQVAAGLAAAHAQGLVHRDIKPANILLSGETERAVITDFGLARAADDATLTRAGVLSGTPQFMAPEQARGESVDARSDIFSLGAVLFTMLAGQPPVPERTGTETIRHVGDVAPPRLLSVNPYAPRWLDQLVGRLLTFDPEQRIGSATEAAELLESVLAWQQDPSAYPVPSELSVDDTRRIPRLPIMLALWAIVVFAVAWQQSQYWNNSGSSIPDREQPLTSAGGADDNASDLSPEPDSGPAEELAALSDASSSNTGALTGETAITTDIDVVVPATNSADSQQPQPNASTVPPVNSELEPDLDELLQAIDRDLFELEQRITPSQTQSSVQPDSNVKRTNP